MSWNLKNKMEVFIARFNSTLTVEGWTSVTNRSLLNIMQVSPTREEFFASVDTSSETKDYHFVAGLMKKYVEKVG